MSAPIEIRHLVFLGDSLSDRGTFDKRMLFGFVPLRYFYEVGFDAPKGRFTNGFVWGDYFVTAVIEQFGIEDARRKLKIPHTARGNADLADAFLANDLQVQKKNEDSFSLNNDKHIFYKGSRFARFFCEAGLTSDNYKAKFTLNPMIGIPRLIVAHLEEKRLQLFADDKKIK